MWQQTCRFWLEDVPPLDDCTRIFLYGLSFVWTLKNEKKKSPLLAAKMYNHIPSKWVYDTDSPSYIFRYIMHPFLHFICRILHISMPQLIEHLSTLCKLSWICVIVGFGGHYSMIAFTATLFTLYGIEQDVIYMCHKFHSLLYVSFALCFSVSHPSEQRGPYSVDYYLFHRHSDHITLPHSSTTFSISSTGFGCKLANVLLIYTLFAAGVCKIKRGPTWLNGERLYHSIYQQAFSVKRRKVRSFAKLLRQHKCMYSFMAVSSVVMELVSAFVLFVYAFGFSERTELWIKAGLVFTFVVFHQIIAAVMLPNFTVQCICYVVCVPFSLWFNPTSTSSVRSDQVPWCLQQEHASQISVYLCFGCFVLVLLCVTMVFGIESYPLSRFSMYSRVKEGAAEQRPDIVGGIQKVFNVAKNGEVTDLRSFRVGKWMKLTLNVYDCHHDDGEERLVKQLGVAQCLKKKRFGGFHKKRRRKDALCELYECKFNALRFPMVLFQGFFGEFKQYAVATSDGQKSRYRYEFVLDMLRKLD